jgi:hypothetical protein
VPHHTTGVDNLVSHLRAARRAGDNFVPADRKALLAEAELALTVQDKEHFLFAMVAVERALNLPGGL